GSYTLTAPSEEGFGGFSVSGAGDMNGDDFPDLVVGAYGSGTAGEAFVVFPGLTGTPPPTMSPTPGPPTPAPVSAGPGATPSPTVNFLVEGVVGAGTVHDSPGVFVRAYELGGQVSLGADRWFDDDTRVAMALEGLQEKSSEGDLVGLGAELPHVADGGGLVYEATTTTNVTVEGLAAQESTMTTSALGGEVSITVTMQVFEEDGVVTSGDEQTEVTAGTLKISLEVSDWPFCDPSTEPRRSTDDTPLTVCPTGTASSSTLETGAFLDVKLAVLGPSSSTPVLSTPAEEDAERNGGVEYTMTGESAEAILVMSEWVSTDDTGWTKSDEVSLSGTSFTVRFPASSGTLLYDPTLELSLVDPDDAEFWRHPWFTWTASSLGALIVVCLLGCAFRRRRRAEKDKVSPGFEAVAPAMDPGDGDGTRPRGRRLGGRVLARMPPFMRIKNSRTGVGQQATATPGGQRYARRVRWRRKGSSSVANLATAGTADNRGGGSAATAAPSSGGGAAAGTPDWIQGLGGELG
ncbi:unnamed protein product, partial [Ectocarpus sp. 12 AP-2014]